MKERYALSIMIVIFIFINSCTTAYTRQANEKNYSPTVYNKIIYIDNDNIEGPWDGTFEHPFQYIGDGINSSTNGDNLYVYQGVYNETLRIDKAITLNGEDKKSTIIDGLYKDIIINIRIDKVNIENFTIRNTGGNKNDSASGCSVRTDCPISIK